MVGRKQSHSEYVRRRYPNDVTNGSLVFAPYGPVFHPAIKWGAVEEDGDTLDGLAFLCPIEGVDHPISMLRSHKDWVLVVDQPWHLRAPAHHTGFTSEETNELSKSGLVFGESTYLRVPFNGGNVRSRWQLIDLQTGDSNLQLNDNGLIYIKGWDLFIGYEETPRVSWPPA